MKAKIRFFARFRELLGTDIIAEPVVGTTVMELVAQTSRSKQEGYNAIFDAGGQFREFVIVMQNGRRLEHEDATRALVGDGDEIAVFPPVAGG
jgi:molybdopterin synthase sulfur carrier subunit